MRKSSCTVISNRRFAASLFPWLLPVLLAFLLAGCTNLFFVPMRQQVLTPAQLGLVAHDVSLTAEDGTKLFAWHLAAENIAGIVCYFHGNAENISTHIVNVAWLPAAGYEVLLVDYRGYGASGGEVDFPAVFADVRAGLDWCLTRGREKQQPVYALGQSLGAALLLEVAAQKPYRGQLAGVAADSSFAGYHSMVRSALAHSWLMFPFQYPLSWLVTRNHDPEDAVRHLAPLPLLVLHSPDDTVVPFAHGERIFSAANGPKCFRRTSGVHNAAFRDEANRRALVAFFGSVAAGPDGLVCPEQNPP